MKVGVAVDYCIPRCVLPDVANPPRAPSLPRTRLVVHIPAHDGLFRWGKPGSWKDLYDHAGQQGTGGNLQGAVHFLHCPTERVGHAIRDRYPRAGRADDFRQTVHVLTPGDLRSITGVICLAGTLWSVGCPQHDVHHIGDVPQTGGSTTAPNVHHAALFEQLHNFQHKRG